MHLEAPQSLVHIVSEDLLGVQADKQLGQTPLKPRVAGAFNPTGQCPACPAPVDKRISQRLIAVGGLVVVGTLDSSCTHALTTSMMARRLIQRGYSCGQCEPFGMLHGKTLRGGGICEWVDVPVAIVHRGLEFRDDLVRLYVYDNGVGDVMLPPAIMETIRCVTQPGRKLLDLEWQ